MAEGLRALAGGGGKNALPSWSMRGSLPALDRPPNLTVLARRELEGLMRQVPGEVVEATRSLAGGGKSAFPIASGDAVRSLRAVEPKRRREGPLGIVTSNVAYTKSLLRGAFYEHTGYRRPAGKYIHRAWLRWARTGADPAAKAALDRAFDRAARRRTKIDVDIGGP